MSMIFIAENAFKEVEVEVLFTVQLRGASEAPSFDRLPPPVAKLRLANYGMAESMDSQHDAFQFGPAMGSEPNWSSSNPMRRHRSRITGSNSESLNGSRGATRHGRSLKSQIGKIDLAGINENVEESAALEDVEKNNRPAGKGLSELHEFEAQDTAPQRGGADENGSSGGVTAADLRAHLEKAAPVRDTPDYAQFLTELSGVGESGISRTIQKLRKVFKFLIPNLGRRINIYLAILFLLFVIFEARKAANAQKIFALFGITALLELVCSVIDRCVYKLIDKAFKARFNVAYQLHAINGPLGLIITVTIMRLAKYKFDARSLVPHWNTYLTAAAVFIICLAVKNWVSRRQFIYLLERRFTDKVESLNTMIIILSELASTRPPKTSTLRRADSSATTGSNVSAGTYSVFTENSAVQGAIWGGRTLVGKVQGPF
jgi:hypothetical protein